MDKWLSMNNKEVHVVSSVVHSVRDFKVHCHDSVPPDLC